MNVVYAVDYVANQHLDRGIAYLRENRFSEAVDEFDKNLILTPNDSYAHWNKAMALLALGSYEDGFREHDWAWSLFDWRGFGPVGDDMDRLRKIPMWDNENLKDKNLIVYHELGFGDAIQTMRYLPVLRGLAKHVTLIISPELLRLSDQFGVEVIDKVPSDLSMYDYRIPFFGVMRALHQTLRNIPRQPYIDTIWQREKGKVGVCWSGRTQNMFSFDYFMMMFDHDDFDLYSLQFDVDHEDVHSLIATDFFDTAGVISHMEHIVTIDSAVAHLAGAMGHPSVHLLLPFQIDWRWWNSEMWYPTIQKHRQECANDWSGPFSELNLALAA